MQEYKMFVGNQIYMYLSLLLEVIKNVVFQLKNLVRNEFITKECNDK